MVASLGLYWWNHVFVVIDLGELNAVCSEPELIVHVADPDLNSQNEIRRVRIDGRISTWLFLPATNLIIRLSATYHDGQERVISYHRVFEPGFRKSKSCRLAVPNADEIAGNPRMAFVSAANWLKGERREEGPLVNPYWIDIIQPTIREYLPDLIMMYNRKQLQSFESVLLTDILQWTDFGEGDLGQNAQQLLVLLADTDSLLSRPECPAPMTEVEAELFASLIGKRLPGRIEWELAARGVDGRQYPWGELLDRDAVNAGLPQEVGWEHRRMLRASIDYKMNKSPFGLFDTVGNAGDWVRDEDGFGFMGGELRLNPEDCTTFSYFRLPSSHSGLADFAWRIGFRGVRSSSVLQNY